MVLDASTVVLYTDLNYFFFLLILISTGAWSLSMVLKANQFSKTSRMK